MLQMLLLQSSLFILHVVGSPQFYGHHGRRVCGQSLHHDHILTTQSYVQSSHKPYITLCHGHRLCSTYKTVYSVAYRQVTRASSVLYPDCCPGWRRLHSHNCNQAVCAQSCLNGGSCFRPDQCVCPSGWRGPHCETDVNECSELRPCAHKCLNSQGSFRCLCRDGFKLTSDGRSCLRLPPPPGSAHNTDDDRQNLAENVTEEMQSLRSRVELLEKTLKMALAPHNSVLQDGLSEQTSLLSFSAQQLDRIDSLSEQIGFLEERLGACSCPEDQRISPIK